MAISINGSTNVISGVAVGGLPDGIVDTDMLAVDAVTAPKIGSKTFVSYAIIADQKSANTNGGTFTTGAWRTRDLNAEISDADGIVSISSNQFTLQSGTYLIKSFAPAYGVDRHQTRLYNITDSSVALTGVSTFASSGSAGSNSALISGRITIASAKVFEIQHRGQTTAATYGLGIESNFATTETFLVIEIYKEA